MGGGGWGAEVFRQADNAAFLEGELDALRRRRRAEWMRDARAAGSALPDAALRAIYNAAWAGEAWLAGVSVAVKADALAREICGRMDARARRIPFPAPVPSPVTD